MARPIIAFLLSLVIPGLGYIQSGDKKNFYRTVLAFFSMLLLGITFRLFTSFLGMVSIMVILLTIYFFAAIHAAAKANPGKTSLHNAGVLKLFFTISFLSITGLSFANRRSLMGFDMLRMDVPVMQPSILQGEQFLIDTWAYKTSKPKRGDIIAHSFTCQAGLYLNRIIAVGPDKIKIKNGIVFINGRVVNEPYILNSSATIPASKDLKEVAVPKDHYFVMGDNRDASLGDSRFSGTITIENIAGKATDIINSRERSRIGITVK